MYFFTVLIILFGVFTTQSQAQDKKRPIKILALGDSLTEGYGVAKEQSYPSLVEKKLRANGWENLTVVNSGSSGTTTAGATQRLQWQLKSKSKPDIVILALGANDGLRGLSVDSAKANLSKTIEVAKQANIKVLLAGMQMPPNYGQAFTQSFAEIFPTLAKEHKVDLIPFLLDKVAGEPSLNLPDGIHPNEKGYEIISETVLNYLRPML
jgi:acyl-CoA thioesterase I